MQTFVKVGSGTGNAGRKTVLVLAVYPSSFANFGNRTTNYDRTPSAPTGV